MATVPSTDRMGISTADKTSVFDIAVVKMYDQRSRYSNIKGETLGEQGDVLLSLPFRAPGSNPFTTLLE